MCLAYFIVSASLLACAIAQGREAALAAAAAAANGAENTYESTLGCLWPANSLEPAGNEIKTTPVGWSLAPCVVFVFSPTPPPPLFRTQLPPALVSVRLLFINVCIQATSPS